MRISARSMLSQMHGYIVASLEAFLYTYYYSPKMLYVFLFGKYLGGAQIISRKNSLV